MMIATGELKNVIGRIIDQTDSSICKDVIKNLDITTTFTALAWVDMDDTIFHVQPQTTNFHI